MCNSRTGPTSTKNEGQAIQRSTDPRRRTRPARRNEMSNRMKPQPESDSGPQSSRSSVLLGKREQELLNYLHQQFPATVGHIPLAEKIHSIWQQGMDDAANIVRERRLLLEKNNCKDPIREHYSENAIRYASHDEGVILDDGGSSGSW